MHIIICRNIMTENTKNMFDMYIEKNIHGENEVFIETEKGTFHLGTFISDGSLALTVGIPNDIGLNVDQSGKLIITDYKYNQ